MHLSIHNQQFAIKACKTRNKTLHALIYCTSQTTYYLQTNQVLSGVGSGLAGSQHVLTTIIDDISHCIIILLFGYAIFYDGLTLPVLRSARRPLTH